MHSPEPPFSRGFAMLSSKKSHPASFRRNNHPLNPQDETCSYLSLDLRTPRLNAIYHHLWLAGLPRPARPLHRQRLMRRTIYITESPDEHMIWHDDGIFIKPIMPEYLLDYDYWERHLCTNEGLFQSARGLFLSYVWLVAYRSDFRIAKELGIMPDEITWETWIRLAHDYLNHVDLSYLQIDKRYHYGELRLSRLNTLYRFSLLTFSLRNLVRGFMSSSTWYTAFFKRNFGWIVVSFIYLTVILSSVQLGLATERLQKHPQFQSFAYGIALTSIFMVFVAMATMLSVWFGLFWFHLMSTIQYSKRVEAERRKSILEK